MVVWSRKYIDSIINGTDITDEEAIASLEKDASFVEGRISSKLKWPLKLEWNNGSYGSQSFTFTATPDKDSNCPFTSAFVKALPAFEFDDLIVAHKRLNIRKVEKQARELGKSIEEIEQAKTEAAEDNIFEHAATNSKVIQDEALFLSIWQEAKDNGDLGLPEDSMLKIPTLYQKGDNFVVVEDLNAQGFITLNYDRAFDDDMLSRVMEALADFHAACWRIKDKLKPKVCQQTGKFNALDALRAVQSDIHFDSRGELEKVTLQKLKDENLMEKVWLDNATMLIGHCDPLAQNIMLKLNDENKVIQVAIVDLGNVAYVNPWFDVIGFITSGISPSRYLAGMAKAGREHYKTRLQMQTAGKLPDGLFSFKTIANGYMQVAQTYESVSTKDEIGMARKVVCIYGTCAMIHYAYPREKTDEENASVVQRKRVN